MGGEGCEVDEQTEAGEEEKKVVEEGEEEEEVEEVAVGLAVCFLEHKEGGGGGSCLHYQCSLATKHWRSMVPCAATKKKY